MKPKKSTAASRRKSPAPAKSAAARPRKPARKSVRKPAEPEWTLHLYVAGQSPKSLTAFANLKRLCDEHLTGRYRIEVIDVSKNPHLAVGDRIVALPTLIRKLPEPIKRVIGDLSNAERVILNLDLLAAVSAAKGTP